MLLLLQISWEQTHPQHPVLKYLYLILAPILRWLISLTLRPFYAAERAKATHLIWSRVSSAGLDARAWENTSPPCLNRTPSPRSFSYYTDWATESKYIKNTSCRLRSYWCHTIFFYLWERFRRKYNVGFDLGLLCFWTLSIVRHSKEHVSKTGSVSVLRLGSGIYLFCGISSKETATVIFASTSGV
jgi:hypothetical protein